MGKTVSASLAIAELREFASFTHQEQLFIERSLDIGLGRGDAFKQWADDDARTSAAIRRQYIAYRALPALRGAIREGATIEGDQDFIGGLVRLSAQDLAHEPLSTFSAYRFLYERLLGAKVRPWLPAAFCGAAALPQICPSRRKTLLQSLSEAAATAPAWSEREPRFFPEQVQAEAA